jgi:uncharacterized protein (DUF305 family)
VNGYGGVVPSLTASVVAVAALAIALSLTGCGSPSSNRHNPPTTTEPTPFIGVPAGYSDDDVSFANNILTHHEQGIDVSSLVPQRSTDADVVTFAAKTAAALKSDIAVLRALSVQWTQSPDTKAGGSGHGGAMQGLIADASIATLKALRGSKFDEFWLQSMTTFDQGAVEMARAEIANGKNIDAIDLAKQIVKAQQQQIGEINRMLTG